MATVTDIQDLAATIHDLRPTWALVATQNALLDYRHLTAEHLTAAALRCAKDPNNRTPAALAWMDLTPPITTAEREFDQGKTKPYDRSKAPCGCAPGRTIGECENLRAPMPERIKRQLLDILANQRLDRPAHQPEQATP